MIKNYTAIIVEDEEMPRLSLMQKLATYHPDIELLDNCEDVDTAFESILKHRPDMVFLDIQLADKTSIEMLERLINVSSAPLPLIIFTTAYNDPQYLLKAIKFDAIDYLLKPVDIEELAIAIKKAKEHLAKIPKAEKLNNGILTLKTLHSTMVANEKEIVYFVAEGNYCKAVLANRTEEMIFERLGEIETRISEKSSIVRAGRSHLINKEFIYKLDNKNNTCQLRTHDNHIYAIHLSENALDELVRLIAENR